MIRLDEHTADDLDFQVIAPQRDEAAIADGAWYAATMRRGRDPQWRGKHASPDDRIRRRASSPASFCFGDTGELRRREPLASTCHEPVDGCLADDGIANATCS